MHVFANCLVICKEWKIIHTLGDEIGEKSDKAQKAPVHLQIFGYKSEWLAKPHYSILRHRLLKKVVFPPIYKT